MRGTWLLLFVFLMPSGAEAGNGNQICNAANNRSLENMELDGSILVRIYNERLEADVRICIMDEAGDKVFDERVRIDALTQFEKRVYVPATTYEVVTTLSDEYGQSTTHSQFAHPQNCDTKAIISSVETKSSPAGIGTSGRGTQCDPSPPKREEGVLADPAIFVAIPSPDNNVDYRWQLLSAAGVLLAVLAFPRPRYFLLALFTRLEGPSVLDQPTRSDIFDLVRNDPGVNPHRIANTLGVGAGETRYHLHVLRRNGVVTEVRRGTLRCYFPAGVASPDRLHATAVLRHATVDRLYETIVNHPNSSLTQLSTIAGLRMSAASKALAKLVAAGLVERVPDGREVRVKTTGLRPLAPSFTGVPTSGVPA